MKTIQKQNILIGFYVLLLISLFLCVVATPLMIRNGIPFTHRYIIEEETFETLLILALFVISFIILRSFMHTLKAYKKIAEHAGKEKSRLVSRLAEAFNYIGTVNVEIQEIESVVCDVQCYPQSRRELKKLVDQLATKAMTVAVAPWLVVRMIDRHDRQTVYEHAVTRSDQRLPSATLGNRAILDGQHGNGLQTFCSPRRNPDLLTVFILPKIDMTEDRTILLKAILNQIETSYMIHRISCSIPVHQADTMKKEVTHDCNY